MIPPKLPGPTLAVTLLLALPGCVDYPDAVAARASHDFHCPEAEVHLRFVSGSTYQAKGCGFNETYTCLRTRGSETACVREPPLEPR